MSKMSSWKALNVESDNESEDEVDNTKEIQIEDALKLYQAALKYHAEGPQSYEKAAEAYKALFDSDIFKYTESLSEYKRHELFGETLVFDTILQDDYDTGTIQSSGANDSAPNTLPQILHLSYKNHGQFMLEAMQHWVRQHGPFPPNQTSSHILGALTYFAEALDKEDTDLDLWLRTASVAALVGSQRITRYCLEAVLDGDDELFDSILRLPGLEEGFAGQQLRDLVAKLEDNLSLMQAPLSTMKRKKLSETLKKRLNPYPFAPLPSEVTISDRSRILPEPAQPRAFNYTKWDWAGVGEGIVAFYVSEQNGNMPDVQPGASFTIAIPPTAEQDQETASDSGPPAKESTAGAAPKDKSEEPKDEPANATETVEKDGDDVVMEDQEKEEAQKPQDRSSKTPTDAATTSTSRKRSTDSAGLPETADGGRLRSKRIRARESITDQAAAVEAAAQDTAKQLEDQLWPYTHADKCLAEVVNDSYAKMGVQELDSTEKLRRLISDILSGSTPATELDSVDSAACDLFTAIQSGASKIAPVMLSADPVDLGGASREAGLNAFLGYAKSSMSQACAKPLLGTEKLLQFVRNSNNGWLSIKEIAFAWIEFLLTPGSFPRPENAESESHSSYMQYRWPEDLKRNLVQMIVNMDEVIYEQMLARVDELSTAILQAQSESQEYSLSGFDKAQIEIVETLFELHLDVYSLIRHPNSGVDVMTQTVQSDRLRRWAILSREVLQMRSNIDREIGLDELALRHIWATVFHMSVDDEIAPDYVIYAMEELKYTFQSLDGRVIDVQNNAVMPELSVAAIDRELVRISMKDFFLKVFDEDEKDPVAVIESLEPILESQAVRVESTGTDDGQEGSRTESSSTPEQSDQQTDVQPLRPSPHQEMRKFLDSASVNLRLSLWQRLREAYESIEYPPKVLSCYLRSVETLVGEFKSSTFRESSQAERHIQLIRRLRIIDEVVVKILQIIRSERTAFDCLSYEHMQTSMSAITDLLRIMSAKNIFQDLVRVGQLPVSRIEGLPAGTFPNMIARLNDVHMRLWMLQYYLLKEGISQMPKEFAIPSDEHFEFLRHVHHATGVRGYSHMAGRQFLRLEKDEILRIDDVSDSGNRDNELAQVLYDLYGLKLFTDPSDLQEFGSSPDILDKRTALSLLPFVLTQVEKVDIKDLAKTDLKVSIDKIHGALGRPKTNEDISLNRKMLTTHFKSPINPISLFNCLKGVDSISTKPIPSEAAVAAAKGWYFLMGNIALNKFRSQKRQGAGPTEDLNFAQAFFLQDLEYSIDRWETWYRLAQANDTQLEEAVLWSAEKMNSNSVELINFQRAAIHCYTMAVACAVRDADPSADGQAKVSQMYTDFGNRIYSSSREPFSMAAFTIRETEHKFYSASASQMVYQSIPFSPLSPYTAWKFAGVLYKRAIQINPDKWWNYFMLGKCQWKMFCHNADAAIAQSRGEHIPIYPNGPSLDQVVDSFISAIETLPEKKGRGGEPILEPHYKLVSVAHKLVHRKAIDTRRAEEIIKHTSYSQNIPSPEGSDDWERYILAVLKALRAADKSAWHHRIIARSAHVIYDDSSDMMVAHGAKHELTQQMFTKTMAVQVWKPENERPGRHFVYTTRYTKFFVHLLDQTGDKVNMEMLARRVRRKQTDFFEHSKLWNELCLRYLKMLRRMGKIPDGHEDTAFRSLNGEEFATKSARLEAWSQNPATQHPVLDVLRDAIELKRINNGLMKAVVIDDLIGDTFAQLYTSVGQTLPPLPSEQQQQQQQQPPTSQSTVNPAVQQPGGSVPVSSLMHSQADGSTTESSNQSFGILQSHLQAQQPQQPPEPAPKSRAKAVGRREIARRAEACAQKPIGATSTTIPIRSPPATTHMALPAPARESPDKAAEPAATTSSEQLQVPNSGTVTAAASVTDVERSAPASVHDDADDESELSELDESEVQEMAQQAGVRAISASQKPLFPNLAANKGKGKMDTATETESGPDEAEDEVNDEEEDQEDQETADEK
ncbi:hypothetical protein BS50DRAFT_676546 [Corynespora cassiicola Philippines]|uniref:Histone transcription regulator 3 homolog n=1 Tax=Corynespora cassiicola Philippines TaxID=1448308 RepID=A0A2T2NNH6_CORCC|nr:hypothetical protein BS50DRAFT_676546 [Corynespora cassiicola Philippines]